MTLGWRSEWAGGGIVYCEGWDVEDRVLVGALDFDEVAARDAAGAQYSVAFMSESRPRVVVNVCREWIHCGIWILDEFGRLTHELDFRLLDDDRMFLAGQRAWEYQDPEAEFMWISYRRELNAHTNGRGSRTTRHPNGVTSGGGTEVGPAPLWRPALRLGEWAAIAQVAHEYGVTERMSLDPHAARADGIRPCDGAAPWSPPIPQQPDHLEALFTPGAMLSGELGDGVPISLDRVADLRFTSGHVVAGEPFDGGAGEPFVQTIPPGTYPVTLALAEIYLRLGHARPAAIRIDLRDVPVHRWELGLHPDEDPRTLSRGAFFGFGVDGGQAFIADAEAVALATADDAAIDEFGDDAPQFVVRTGLDHPANVFICWSGAGDGAYPTWFGRDDDGQIASIVVDFLLFGTQPQRRTKAEVKAWGGRQPVGPSSPRQLVVPPDEAAVEQLWEEFGSTVTPGATLTGAVTLGDDTSLINRLADLIVNGTKRAHAELASTSQRTPQVGDYRAVLRADFRPRTPEQRSAIELIGMPVGIIVTTDVQTKPYREVDEQFALDQGEGDRTLAWWHRVHRHQFARQCRERDLEFTDDTPVIFERFELVWPIRPAIRR